MPSKTSKHARTESTRKCQGRENEEDLKHECKAKKATSKACKDCRDEAKEDDLLVDQPAFDTHTTIDIIYYSVYTLKLETDNKRMAAKLQDCSKKTQDKLSKIIPALPNASDADVELLHMHLNLLGKENDFEWLGYRTNTCQCIYSGHLARCKQWAKQKIKDQNMVIQVVENQWPKLKNFEDNWGAIFLLKQCQDNSVNYLLKQDMLDSPDATSTDGKSSHHNSLTTHDGESDNDDDTAAACKVALQKATLECTVLQKATKLKAKADLEAELAADNNNPTNDGETEPEELSEQVCKAVEHEEIGVTDDSDALPVAIPKKKRACTDGDGSTDRAYKHLAKKAAPTNKKQTTYMKKGGWKSVGSGAGNPPCASTSKSAATDPEDNDDISTLSGQTSSDTDDD
ncbi:hypothetical protein FRC11_008248 [Ceratobasidium sp. 423]|nr:hypothetical protein FRC11_008248 [Ceratobasidium sp. 423]